MPPDLTLTHIFAAIFLLVAWFGHALILRLFASGTLNSQLNMVRRQWISQVTRREGNPYDAILLGHTVNSAAFFGSATLLVLAGVISLLANLDATHVTLTKLPMISNVSIEFFALEVMFVTTVLAISFFTFTYTLRKLIYTVVLIGGLPRESDNHPEQDRLVESTATVLGEAIKSFNFGIRGYYYAAAALFMFISPIACVIATLVMAAVLFYRQLATRTSTAMHDYVKALGNG
ncbi:MAG: DUF599 domain-containing protein [Hyphomicrobiaceae bacterium]